MSADNLAMGVAGTALIAYLSSLTSASYTATQYALFSSMYALPGKLLMGTSGFVVDAIGYPWFFVYTSSLGLPGAGDAVFPHAAGPTAGHDGRHRRALIQASDLSGRRAPHCGRSRR